MSTSYARLLSLAPPPAPLAATSTFTFRDTPSSCAHKKQIEDSDTYSALRMHGTRQKYLRLLREALLSFVEPPLCEVGCVIWICFLVIYSSLRNAEQLKTAQLVPSKDSFEREAPLQEPRAEE